MFMVGGQAVPMHVPPPMYVPLAAVGGPCAACPHPAGHPVGDGYACYSQLQDAALARPKPPRAISIVDPSSLKESSFNPPSVAEAAAAPTLTPAPAPMASPPLQPQKQPPPPPPTEPPPPQARPLLPPQPAPLSAVCQEVAPAPAPAPEPAPVPAPVPAAPPIEAVAPAPKAASAESLGLPAADPDATIVEPTEAEQVAPRSR